MYFGQLGDLSVARLARLRVSKARAVQQLPAKAPEVP